ncbi:hypothetical protein ACN47E_008561 [Coniothyrium glycines]
MTKAPNNIVLYTYGSSLFGKRVSSYLALRGIEYALCDVPITMPRPELALLPVAYRRIPILAVGRDVFLDTRLILRKLEALFPSPKPLAATNPHDAFITGLIERHLIEGPVFAIATGLIPVEIATESTFNDDRKGFLGRNWTKEELEEGRGECLAYVKGLFSFLEETILQDGRDWILKGNGPSIAEVNAVFLLEFLIDLQLPAEHVSDQRYPKTFAWIARYQAARDQAKSSGPEPTVLDGAAAAKQIHASDFVESALSVDADDPLGLKEGAEVELYAADWGTEHRDRGRLVGLTTDEVTIAVKSEENVEIRIHAPRTGFKIKVIRES